MVELRDYQRSLIDGARTNIREGVKRQLLVAPTGAGKTVLAAFMQGGAARQGRRSWFVVHRKEIIDQTAATFRMVGIQHSFVATGETFDPRPLVHLCGVATLANRMDKLEPPGLIVWDECHHIAAASWQAIMQAFPDCYHIGLSATPQRLDGKGLKDFFDKLVVGPTTAELIRRGFLAPYRYFAPGQPDLAGVNTTAGDFNRGQLAGVMDRPKIIGDAIEHYQRLIPGRRAIVFAVSREHSRHVAEAFNSAGVPALHVDGAMRREERDEAFARFRAGDVRILSNVELAGEGVDIPAIEAAILLRPTKSLALYLQQAGRSLRIFEGKSGAVILDHAGNALVHGLPDDPREWTLDGRQSRKRAAGPSDGLPVRQCLHCYQVSPSRTEVCPCGEPFPARVRAVETEAGELFELDKGAIELRKKAAAEQRKRENAACVTMGDFIRLGMERGYDNPKGWAFAQIRMREQYRGRFQVKARRYG